MTTLTPFTVRPALLSDLPTLTTIVPRSFHPTNPYIRTLFPATPLLQTWWNEIFTSRITQPEPKISHLLVVTRSKTNPKDGKNNNDNEPNNESQTEETLGVLSMAFFPPHSRGAGFYTTHPPTPDHDAASYAAVERNLASAREELMGDSAHFAIELFGVDHGFKGQGLGKLLLRRACKIADEAGVPTFVMANASARGVYPKVGFGERRRVVLPGSGEGGYEEFMLVREVGVGEGE